MAKWLQKTSKRRKDAASLSSSFICQTINYYLSPLIGNPIVSTFAMHEAALQFLAAARSTFDRGKKQCSLDASMLRRQVLRRNSRASLLVQAAFPLWVGGECASSYLRTTRDLPTSSLHIWLKIHQHTQTDRPSPASDRVSTDVVHTHFQYCHFMHLQSLCAD